MMQLREKEFHLATLSFTLWVMLTMSFSIDRGDTIGIQRATSRVTIIANGSRDDADMEISVSKTKVLHVRRQDSVRVTTSDEAKKVCNHVCPHLNCGYRFCTKRGANIHAGKCKWASEHVVEKILDCEGPPTNRKYLIKWGGVFQ